MAENAAALNEIAAAVERTMDADGFVPLSVRYRAARAAVGVVEGWNAGSATSDADELLGRVWETWILTAWERRWLARRYPKLVAALDRASDHVAADIRRRLADLRRDLERSPLRRPC